MATIYEVSALAGVSVSSVSRAMNDHQHVSEKTKKKVQEAMAQLGYKPNSSARSLASSRTNSIGVLVSELHGPFYGDMLSGIESELKHSQKHTIIAAGHSDEKSELDSINFLIERNCDALILHVDAVSDDYLIELSKGPIPCVIINRYIAEIANNCIHVDNKLGGYQATKYLLEHGHSELAYISGPDWKSDSQGRLEGHIQALNEYNLVFERELLYTGNFETSGGIEGMKYFLSQNKPFTAVICANDEMASGAMKVAREQHLHVPNECSIVGFDNVFFTEYLHPQMTTIDNPVNEIGHMAAKWVLKQVYKKDNLEIKNLFEPTLIIRESSKAK